MLRQHSSNKQFDNQKALESATQFFGSQQSKRWTDDFFYVQIIFMVTTDKHKKLER